MNSQNEQMVSLIQKGLDLANDNNLQEAKKLFIQICETNPNDAEAWFQLSTIHGRLGEIDAAGECCFRALEIQPDHCDALVNLGNVLYSQGKANEAATAYRKALQINPYHATVHSNLGNLLSADGKYDEAIACYQTAIQLDANLYIAYYGLGNLRLNQHQYDKAANCYRRTIQLSPNDAKSWNLLGVALFKLGNLEEALSCLRNATRLKPDYVEAYNIISSILMRQGKQAEALEQHQLALQYAPTSPEAYNNLGTFYLEQQELDKAIACYQNALKIDPQYLPALNNLGYACRTHGNFHLFIANYLSTVNQTNDARAARKIFIENIKNVVPADYDHLLDDELKKCLMLNASDYRSITPFISHHLKYKYKVQQNLEYSRENLEAIIGQITSDDLFLMYLNRTINTDPDLELALTKIRSYLLSKQLRENGISPEELRVVSTMAFQCLNNEYVFSVDETEEKLILQLRARVEEQIASLDSPTADLERNLLLFGMYNDLYSLSCKEKLIGMPLKGWSNNFRPLFEQTLINSMEEDKIKQEILTIGCIEDKTSQAVQSQYEENPYPRWLSVPETEKTTIARSLRQSYPYFAPPPFLDGPIQILVAGCGTGLQPILSALAYSDAEILAVDISKSSLAYAIRMARKYGISNIKFMQGDILELAKLNRRFHVIECFGVLHHMEEPVKGWTILSNLLVEHGVMYIGLYSEIARKQIVAARELIEKEKILPDKNSIRNFRKRILRHELGPLLYGEMSKSYDFYSTSRCRDLLFHFKEHRFTLPQISKILKDLRLNFIGFDFGNMKGYAADLYHSQFPEDVEMRNLASWDQFEYQYPLTFSRCYSFWCQKEG